MYTTHVAENRKSYFTKVSSHSSKEQYVFSHALTLFRFTRKAMKGLWFALRLILSVLFLVIIYFIA